MITPVKYKVLTEEIKEGAGFFLARLAAKRFQHAGVQFTISTHVLCNKSVLSIYDWEFPQYRYSSRKRPWNISGIGLFTIIHERSEAKKEKQRRTFPGHGLDFINNLIVSEFNAFSMKVCRC